MRIAKAQDLTADSGRLPMGRMEFIALMAMMFATIAFSIDAMLPALDDIALELSPEEPTLAALIMTSFFLGMGAGTFVAGPLSDAYGRRTMMFFGAALYSSAAAVAWMSSSLEVMLAARFIQGIGASGPRVVCIAIIRDLYSGREMARILSIVMMIFTIVPAFAPALGVAIIHLAGWRAIFAAFIAFSLISALWLGFRLPETLPYQSRRPMRFRLIFDSVKEMFSHPVVCLSILIQTLMMGMLFSLLAMIQPIYAQVFDKAESFPFWFGGIALTSAAASLLNAMLVMRLGMRKLITVALTIQVVLSSLVLISSETSGAPVFAIFAVWQAYVFFQAGLTVGNLNAIAMEPMGHIAGMAASVIGAVSTVLAAAIASPVGLLFDGTFKPLLIAVLIMACLALSLTIYMGHMERRLARAL